MEDSGAVQIQDVSETTPKIVDDRKSRTVRHLVFAAIIAGLSLLLSSKVGKSLPGVAVGVSFTVIAVSQGYYAFQATRNKQDVFAKSPQSLDVEAKYFESLSVSDRRRLAFAGCFGSCVWLLLAVVLTVLVVASIFGCAVMVVYGLPWWGDALTQLIASALTIYVLGFWRSLIVGIRQTRKPKYRFLAHTDS